jgi:hypothetical protein
MRPLGSRCRALRALAALVALLAASGARAQARGAAAVEAAGEKKLEEREAEGHNLAFTAVPGPLYNPSLGWGLMVIGMAMYDVDPADKVSPGSTSGAFGMFTENGSWAAGLMQKLYLSQDTWRISGGGGYANVNQRFYGIGGDATGDFVDMTMEAVFAVAEALRQVVPNGYAGLSLSYRQSRFLGKDAFADSVIGAAGLNQTWEHALLPGLRFDYDTRDVQTSPRSGGLGKLTARGASEKWGSTSTYARVSASYSRFHALDAAGRHVLAWNVLAEGGFGDVPFDEYPDIGGNKALRGYIRGQFTDKNMASAQLEWRWSAWRALGLAVFGGAGKVFPAWDQLGSEPWLPSAGVGLRYMVIADRRMNARLDFAWGKEGGTFYFGVGEAF